MSTGNLKLWTDALRTTSAHQTEAVLGYREDGQEFMCCLGVGCSVATVEVEWLSGRQLLAVDELGTYTKLPPLEFLTWLGATPDHSIGTEEGFDVTVNWPYGLKDHEGRTYQSTIGYYSVLNDVVGLTFAQIADIADYLGVV